MVDHGGTRDDPVLQVGVEIGFLETVGEPRAQLLPAVGQQGGRVLELAGVLRVGGEDRLHIAGVVGVELALDDGFRRKVKRSHFFGR